MAPRRSGRRNASVYKKDDYIEYQYKGSTVTGKLLRKSRGGTEAQPIWIVTPSDRRRKNEDIPEKALGKVINAEEAMSNRGPKLKKAHRSAGSTSSSPTSAHSHSDGSAEEAPPPKRKGGKGSPVEDPAQAHAGSATGKRKSSDAHSHGHGEGPRAPAQKTRKVVTFSREAATAATAHKHIARKKSKKAKTTPTRIGTRSTRGSSEAVYLPDLPARKKNLFKTKRVKKDENVKIVKMLTGTLYLYRGDRPRAEFVRSK